MSDAQSQILSIDDDPDTLALIQLLLAKKRYRARTAASGAKAFEALAEGFRPDLILLDVDMPDADGYQVCRQMQQDPALALIPVVFLTALKTDEDRLKAFAAGGVDFLTKPVSQNRLYEVVQKHLETRRQWAGQLEAAKSRPQKASTGLVPARPGRTRPPAQAETALPSISSDFSRFRERLFQQCGLPQEAWSAFSRTPDTDIYAAAAAHGVSSRLVAESMARFLGLPFLPSIQPATVAIGILPTPFCRRNLVVPILASRGAEPIFVVSNPFNVELMDTLRRFKKSPCQVTDPENIQIIFGGSATSNRSLNLKREVEVAEIIKDMPEQYQAPRAALEAEATAAGEDAKAEGPVIRLVNRIIAEACRMRASDIHIEPRDDEVLVRYRIDGELQEILHLKPPGLSAPLAARIKIMAGLDIAEKRLPQDGRIALREFSPNGPDFDLRVATVPVQYGEKIVMRLLDRQKAALPLAELGFSPRSLAIYRERIRTPYGMILHVGPTGSGKSMTLYAALREILRPGINIQTAEDPIEYTLRGISQTQVKPLIGLTFAAALRAFLRLDPDVILVGEIRDRETAHIAAEAALTGHLLLSTLHTNDAAATLTRFVEMGVEPFMLSSSIEMICAQRLIRRLCPHCREAYEPAAEEKALVGADPGEPLTLYRPKGCEACSRIGYQGRLGVHELLVPDEAMRHRINQPGVTAEELKQMAVAGGMLTLYQDAMEKVRQGHSSVAEVLSRIRPDGPGGGSHGA